MTGANSSPRVVRFVFYGDSCSGIPGTIHSRNLAGIHRSILAQDPRADILVFLGDHIDGITDAETLRRQWRYFFDREFKDIAAAFPRPFPVTSNHTVCDLASAEVWREVFSRVPQNGPPGQEGLACFVRNGELLLVFANTVGYPPKRGASLEAQWLDSVLQRHADAAIK